MVLNTRGADSATRLLKHILEVVVLDCPSAPNREAGAIFDAINLMFDGSNMGDPVTVDPYLVHNLAACAKVSLIYDARDHIPWDELDHDAIIVRTLNGMVRSLIIAVQEGKVMRRDGKVYCGGFQIPDWLVEEARK